MLSDLNPQQREAVQYLDGPLLVLAGAGSGKTRVITRKVAYLIAECGMSARNIAAITFTNKAAREMRERVATLIQGKQAQGLTIATFHALGLNILRSEAHRLRYKPRFSVFDAHDAQALLNEALKAPDKETLKRAQALISHWKNALIGPEAASASAGDAFERQVAAAYRLYQDGLLAYQAVDFDDLIRLPVALFRQDSEALATWQGRLRYLLVDEYQDTNAAQYALMRLLVGPAGRFTAVGDDDQAIYAWRGADVANLRRLGDDYPRLKVIALTQNYRSCQRILQAANSIIRNNTRLADKRLWSELGPGDPLEILQCRDEAHEAETVAMRISAHRFERRGRYGDYAVLYRSNHQARAFEAALRSLKIPYVVSGGQSFFERAEIKDITAYLRLIANSDDDPAFIRAVTTPKRGIGAATLKQLGAYAAARRQSLFAAIYETGLAAQLTAKQHEPLIAFGDFINRMAWRAEREPATRLLQELLAAIQYEAWLYDNEEARSAQAKWSNVRDFVEWLGKKGEEEGKTLIELAQTVALINLLDGQEDAAVDAVRLSTLHAAKGLEFPHVFLVGLEEEILPHRECREGERLAEERRLLYVGITRAQKSLTLTWCARRKRGGDWDVREPSRFLAEIDPTQLKRGEESDPAASRQAGRARLASLKAMLMSGE